MHELKWSVVNYDEYRYTIARMHEGKIQERYGHTLVFNTSAESSQFYWDFFADVH